jgi:hypothetical protein
MDQVVQRVRRTENRARLEQATAAYFARLSPAAAREEKKLGLALGQSADEVSFDDGPRSGDTESPLRSLASGAVKSPP